jgi:replicative DNA helicase
MTVLAFPSPEERIRDVEAGLLGILLAHPDRLNDVRDIITGEMFFYLVNRQIYDAIREHSFLGRQLDLRTVMAVVRDDSFGGVDQKKQYLADLLACFASELNAKSYAHQIKDFYNRRRIRDITESAVGEHEKAQAISDLWRSMGQAEGSGFISLQSAMQKTLERIGETFKRGNGFEGLATGLVDLDKILSGLENGGLYVLAGRPAMGKTAAALSMAMNVATRGSPVLFFSLEMSAEQLTHRVNARYAETSMWAQKNGPKDLNFHNLVDAQHALANVPLSIIDRAGLSAEQIVSKAHEAARRQRPRLIVIDHLGIIAARDARVPRVYQVAEMTMLFKALAKELDVPILLLHQLNRGVEGRDDKRPSLADLRDSGSVEQDADVVMLLYRKEYYLTNREPTEEKDRDRWMKELMASQNMAEIIIAKNRQGESRTVLVRFDAIRQVFENLGEH